MPFSELVIVHLLKPLYLCCYLHSVTFRNHLCVLLSPPNVLTKTKWVDKECRNESWKMKQERVHLQRFHIMIKKIPFPWAIISARDIIAISVNIYVWSFFWKRKQDWRRDRHKFKLLRHCSDICTLKMSSFLLILLSFQYNIRDKQ